MIESAAYVRKKNRKKTKFYKINTQFGSTLKTKLEVRKELYRNGFILDDVYYKFLCRTSSKARVGQALFIDSEILDDFRLWCRMNLKFEFDEPCDIASLLAYESLVLSGIIKTINILPEEILLIPDLQSHFIGKASVTEYDAKQNKLIVEEKDEPQTSDIWDGQSLMDKSKFTGDFEGRSALLLRNKFFKSCAFNCNMQKWFADHNITQVIDMFGQKHDADKIKLITTPNSVKALKFSYKLPGQSEEDMFHHWIKNINYDFGVCKTDETTADDNGYTKLSYQMVNSLPLNKDQVRGISKFNIDQINRINTDYKYFRDYLGADTINLGAEMLYNIICVNPDVQFTNLYLNKRRDIIDDLKNKMRKGHVKVKSDYSIMVGNPIEMLMSASGIEWSSSLHDPYEIHSTMFDNGSNVACFRNPHVASGNVCILKNKRLPEIDEYMNLTNNIVVINAFKNDILSRLQGADFDSDTVLITNNSIILEVGKRCMKFATPLNKIKGEKSNFNKYNPRDIAETDHIIAENAIGQVINLSQLFNSYYWDSELENKSKQELQIIYDQVSKLSSLSQVEIDRAKKFITLDTGREMRKIVKTVFNEKELAELEKEGTVWEHLNGIY